MDMSIGFPNLGIELRSVGKSISILGFEIAFYGIVIGIGIMMGLYMATKEAKRSGQNPETYYDLVMYGVLFSFLGARLYYVAFSWDYYKNNLGQILNIRQGGLAIYGGVIAAVLVAVVFSRKRRLAPLQVLDTAVIGLITGQAIGRWGNFFNREAFGEYSDNILAMRLPVSAVRNSEITELMTENIEIIDGISFIQVHPTFLYECLWSLGVLLVLWFYRSRKKFQGELFCIYLLGYGLGRVWIEHLRTDQLQLSNGMAISQLLALAMVVLATIVIIFGRYTTKVKK